MGHWKAECARFFDNRCLRTSELTISNWNRDQRISTIWLWKDSMIANSRIAETVLSPNVNILVVAADESHFILRDKGSQRCRSAEKVLAKAKMVVQTSGTIWPYGPKQDGKSVLTMLGGPLEGPNSKWQACGLAKQLKSLFKQSGGEYTGWDIRRFRRLVTPFYICRTGKSRWVDTSDPDRPRRRRIIPAAHARPEPIIISPEACPYEAEALELTSRTSVINSGRIQYGLLKARSTHAMIMAWYGKSLYLQYKSMEGRGKEAVEHVISSSLRTHAPSGRVKTLCGLLRTVVEENHDRFVIFTESIPLCRLATYVRAWYFQPLI
jgi:hypothetical protein